MKFIHSTEFRRGLGLWIPVNPDRFIRIGGYRFWFSTGFPDSLGFRLTCVRAFFFYNLSFILKGGVNFLRIRIFVFSMIDRHGDYYTVRALLFWL